MNSRAPLIGIGVVVSLTFASAQSAPRPFRHERPIVTAGAGHYRLAIDATLLAGAVPFDIRERPSGTPGEPAFVAEGGLSDLRLFDAANREVPYLLVRPATTQPVWVRGALQPIAETKKASGFEVDLGAVVASDRVRVDGLPAPFLKRLQLEASGDRQHWTLAAAEGTLFDLPDARLLQLELPFAAGDYRYLRVTWDDTNSGRVPMPRSVAVRRVAVDAPARLATVSLAVERRPSEPGLSRYVVRLPGAHLPVAAIVLDVRGDHILRKAAVTESRLVAGEAAPALLGRATLRRVQVGSLTASDVRIPIVAPTEAQINVTIDDGDNPPLAIVGVTAEFAELPWIYFESDGSPLVARYGRDAREPPRYDLEAVRESLRIDRAQVARWGEARALEPASDAAAAPLATEGASIDVSLFRHVRELPSGDAGLVALSLDAAVLAESAGPGRGFRDVRIVSADGHQVPYLIERRDEPLGIDVTLVKSSPPAALPNADRRSVYRLHLPFAALPPAQLVLTTDSRVFDRRVMIGVERAPDRLRREAWIDELASASWVHADRERPAPPLVVGIAAVNSADLLVVIDEGDNQPLPLGPARLLLPSYRLRFYRSVGSVLRAAYGRDDLAPPRYDLALLAPQVLGVAATDLAIGREATPAASAKPVLAVALPVVFWTVLAVAVVVLLGFVARLLRKSGPD